MKKVVLYFFTVFCTGVAMSQNWEPDYASAVQQAKEHNKPIVLVFAGSDWCAPCIKLDREIWQSDSFRQYAAENYILYKADFPRKKGNRLSERLAMENARLAESYNPNGHFPLVVVLDSEQEVLGNLGYEKTSPESYIERLNSFLK